MAAVLGCTIGKPVAINETFGGVPNAVSPVNFADWQASARAFERMALYTDGTATLPVAAGAEHQAEGRLVARNNTDAEKMAEIVKSTFQNRLETVAVQGGNQPNPMEIIQALRGGGRGRRYG